MQRRTFALGVSALLLQGRAWGAGPGLASRLALNLASVEARQAAPDPDPGITTLYRGLVGDDRVQLAVSAKPDEGESFGGHYFIFGGGSEIAVAGEIDGDGFYMEESEDGTAISGSWEGKLSVEEGRAVIVGDWRNVDETRVRPFKLEPVMRTRNLFRHST